MHTEQTTNFSARVAVTDMQITDEYVVWMPSPLGHSTGFNYGLRFALSHGLPLVLQDRWDAAVAADLVQRQRCSYTLAATTFLRELVAESARRGARLDVLRCFGCGGAPVPPAGREADPWIRAGASTAPSRRSSRPGTVRTPRRPRTDGTR
jgi:acyl-coenzyme A synthetase/AMP-(fatty) acid ligase